MWSRNRGGWQEEGEACREGHVTRGRVDKMAAGHVLLTWHRVSADNELKVAV